MVDGKGEGVLTRGRWRSTCRQLSSTWPGGSHALSWHPLAIPHPPTPLRSMAMWSQPPLSLHYPCGSTGARGPEGPGSALFSKPGRGSPCPSERHIT